MPELLIGFRLVYRATLLLIALLLATSVATAQAPIPTTLKQIGVIDHPPIREASGLVASRRFDDVLWAITDSGGPPHLYALTGEGKLLAEYEVRDAANLDWESLAIDDQGFLYIADVGNNLQLPLRWVYQIREPDPRAGTSADPTASGRRVVNVEQILTYTFPEQPLDVEGTFVLGDALLLISKVRSGTAIYRLPIPREAPEEPQPGPSVSAAVKLQRLGSIPAVTVVTGADISHDGRRIAIVTYREVVIYELNGDVVTVFSAAPAVRVPFQAPAIEGCCWLGKTLLLVSEDRSLYCVALDHAEQ